MPDRRKNLLFIHLESISWQTLNAFPESFPNLFRFMPGARRFRSYFSSATSTQMVLAFLLHGNDFELDASPRLAPPAANNPSLLSTLEAEGYGAAFLCVSAFNVGPMLPNLAQSLPAIWTTDDFAALLAKFEAAIAPGPFAVYVWNLVTHIEHAMAFESFSESADDLLSGVCAVADRILGALLELLERRGLLDQTTVVVFGDHGDDFWTHGFKRGLMHGVEPYTHITHAPLLIRDADLPAGDDYRLASTIDIAPTCLDLAKLSATLAFPESGVSLASGPGRSACLSQNFTANQPDSPARDLRKAFAICDGSYALMATSRGLELFNHKLDPTNHCNLLHLFDMADGELVLNVPGDRTAPHFAMVLQYMDGGERAIPRRFKKLQHELKRQVANKDRYVRERARPPFQLLDPARLDVIDRRGRDAFFGAAGTGATPGEPPSLLRKVRNAMLGRSRHAGR